MIVLVDTSIWSLAFRRKKETLHANQQQQLHRLKEIIVEGRARLLGSVRQELLSGIRSPEQFGKLRDHLRFFPDVELETDDYESAANIRNTCSAHGIAGSPIDFLLCSVALRRGWSIFTADRDFESYGRHIPITLLR